MKFKSSAIIIAFINVIKNPNLIEIERFQNVLDEKSFLKMIMTIRMPAIMILGARSRNSDLITS